MCAHVFRSPCRARSLHGHARAPARQQQHGATALSPTHSTPGRPPTLRALVQVLVHVSSPELRAQLEALQGADNGQDPLRYAFIVSQVGASFLVLWEAEN